MQIKETNIDGVKIINSTKISDVRGEFSRFFCENELRQIIGKRVIKQINISKNYNVGCIRGLHYQLAPYGEMKIIRCIKGRVYDVVVDLRRGSNTFLNWTAVELSSNNNCAIVIPEGFAHGFQVLESDSHLLYLHTQFYNKDAEGGISYADPSIGIQWPVQVTDISHRDSSHPAINNNFKGI